MSYIPLDPTDPDSVAVLLAQIDNSIQVRDAFSKLAKTRGRPHHLHTLLALLAGAVVARPPWWRLCAQSSSRDDFESSLLSETKLLHMSCTAQYGEDVEPSAPRDEAAMDD